MHKKIIILLTIILLQGCQTVTPIKKEKDVKMNYLESKYFTRYKEYTTEKFDVDAYDEMIKRQEGNHIRLLEDGTEIVYGRPYFKEVIGSGERTSRGGQKITPSKPYFIEISKIFSPKGNLIRQGFFISGRKVGIAQIFNEAGKLIEEIDYEKKDWSKYHYSDVLKFLDKERVIDLKTGRGRDTFSFYLNREKEQWHIEVIEAPENGYVATIYTLDANTLEVLEVKKEGRGIE